jgi:hypothetical protein
MPQYVSSMEIFLAEICACVTNVCHENFEEISALENLASTICHGSSLIPTICFQGCLRRNKDGYSGRSSWHKKNYSAAGGFWRFGAQNRCRGELVDKYF